MFLLTCILLSMDDCPAPENRVFCAQASRIKIEGGNSVDKKNTNQIAV